MQNTLKLIIGSSFAGLLSFSATAQDKYHFQAGNKAVDVHRCKDIGGSIRVWNADGTFQDYNNHGTTHYKCHQNSAGFQLIEYNGVATAAPAGGIATSISGDAPADSSPSALPPANHNTTRSNRRAGAVMGPGDGDELSDKEKCEADGGKWYVAPGRTEGICLKTLQPENDIVTPGGIAGSGENVNQGATIVSDACSSEDGRERTEQVGRLACKK
jgi:hypothetical protein